LITQSERHHEANNLALASLPAEHLNGRTYKLVVSQLNTGWVDLYLLNQGCQIFLGTMYQNEKKSIKITAKFTKWS
jgi:hypothetical protein